MVSTLNNKAAFLISLFPWGPTELDMMVQLMLSFHFLNILIYDRPTPSIILINENLKAYP